METTADRTQEIRTRAEEIAMELIRNDLQSSDPSLSGLCSKLRRFKPLLSKSIDEAKTRQLIRSGLGLVKRKPGSGPVGAEAVELLDGLADKLGGMAGMFGHRN